MSPRRAPAGLAASAGWIGIAVALVVACARPGTHGGRAGVYAEALARQPIRFRLDVPYAGTPHPRQRLDLYLPAAPASDALPVIVFLHGGGWHQGDKADGAARLVPFVRAGAYAGVSVGYRLSGDAPWPAQIHDCKAAIRWIRANAGEYGLDPQRIAVWGRSAGAHLALMLGVTGDVPALEGRLGPHTNESSAVSGVVNFFGVTEIAALAETGDAGRTGLRSAGVRLLGGALPDVSERARAASPLTWVTSDDPPVLTLHGSEDHTVPYDQAVRLHRALSQAGVPSILIAVRGAGHGAFPDGAEERAAAFFDAILRGKDVEVPTRPLAK